jgi:DNA-binding transcriptional LysR family regulator
MYDIAARPFLQNSQLEPILQQWSCGREPVLAVIPSSRKVPAKVRAFIDFMGPLLK